ncbi:unnamed protein product, partial [Prorocentrum cordatum]
AAEEEGPPPGGPPGAGAPADAGSGGGGEPPARPCRQLPDVGLSPVRGLPAGGRLLPPNASDPAGPTGVFQDWVVVPEARAGGPVVGVVLLRHESVHVYNFDIREAPDWAKQIFAVNREFCQRHGYKWC